MDKKRIRKGLVFGMFLALATMIFVAVSVRTTMGLGACEITTGPINSVAFQALIDSVPPKCTIKCLGGDYHCQPPPIRITKPLRIIAEDEDNPPVFIGNGDFNTNTEDGNNCFAVYNLRTDIKGLEFSGLHFTMFDRALVFSPSYDPSDPAEPIEEGVLSDLRIVRCQVSVGRRGIQVWGKQTKKFNISENRIEACTNYGILAYGSPAETYDGELYNPGRPKQGTIAGNIVSSCRYGISANGCERASIFDNFIEGGYVGILFGDEVANRFPDDGPIHVGSVFNNEVQSLYGIVCVGPTTLHQSLVQGNSIGYSRMGIFLCLGANSFLITNNQCAESIVADIYLAGAVYDPFPPPSHDNMVIATDFTPTVVDNGINNILIGTLAMIENPGVSDEVRQMLIELRDTLAERKQQ